MIENTQISKKGIRNFIDQMDIAKNRRNKYNQYNDAKFDGQHTSYFESSSGYALNTENQSKMNYIYTNVNSTPGLEDLKVLKPTSRDKDQYFQVNKIYGMSQHVPRRIVLPARR